MMTKIDTLISYVNNLFTNKNQYNMQYLKDAIVDITGVEIVNCIFTNNTDKLPFGVLVYPEGLNIQDILWYDNTKSIKIDKVSIEIDSKCILYGLTPQELTAIILSNIYALCNNESPIERVREIINLYLTERSTMIKMRESIQYEAILEYGVKDTLVKLTNCLYLDSDVITDANLDSVGLVDEFASGLGKLFNKIPGCESVASRRPCLIILDWCLRLYKNVAMERIPAVKQLQRAKELTASVLLLESLDKIIIALNRIDTDTYISESYIEMLKENETKKKRGLFYQMKYNGMRAIEDDFYEYVLLARNAGTEYEVLYALKQINARLTILDDYIRNGDLDETEKKRWFDLYNRYIAIREEIAKKKVYNKRNYGIFIDYNKLDDSDDEYDDSDI